MKYLKSFKFWIIFIALLYTGLGFVFIPWFLTNKIPTLVEENSGINIDLGKAKFNPYTFKLSIDKVLLRDLNKKPVVGFKNITIDYTLLGLLEKTILFKSIDIDSPKFYTRIYADGKINLEQIIPKNETNSPKNEQNESSSLPIIVLQELNIKNGHLLYDDLRGKKPFSLELGPFNFLAHDISTKEGELNAYSFKTKLQNDGQIAWEGGMKIKPLSLYGELNIKDFYLPEVYDYILPNIGADLTKGTLSIKIPYQVDLSKDIQANINNANILLKSINFEDKTNHKELINISQINLDGLNLAYPEQDITINSLNIDNSSIFTLLNKEYSLNLQKAFEIAEDTNNTEITKEDKNSTKAWNFALKEANINNAFVSFNDMTLQSPLIHKLQEISLHVNNITSNKSSQISYELKTIINQNSELNALGNVTQEPLLITSDISLANLHVKDFVEYIKPYVNVNIKNADVDLKAKLEANLTEKTDIKLSANTSIKDLHINSQDDEKLLSWKNLDINGINYQHEPMELSIKELKLMQPYIRAHIAKDGTTNFSNLTKESQAQEKNIKTDEEKKSAPMKIKIGPMKLVNGTSDFSDFSLPFAFQTHIHDLNGKFSTLDFQSTAPSRLNLNGKIDEYGYTDIKGILSPFNIKENAHLNLLFKNIDLSNVSPYSGKFVGYKIKSGKLSMDLKYDIKKAKLVGENQINIDTLTLGEQVESPDAVNLPLGLAIALLKDSNGQIDIDLPVSGDMDNPEFSYGGVIWSAIGNMITGIVTAPFNFLGSMLGIDGDELKAIDFEVGSSAIVSTEHEKFKNLEKILSKRPGINLKIKGSYDEVFDLKAFQELAFREKVKEELKTIKTNKDAKKRDIYIMGLKSLYLKQFGEKKYTQLQESIENQAKEAKKDFDIVAFNRLLQTEMTQSIKIEKDVLIGLANERANNIKNILANEYKIDIKRIQIEEPQTKEAKRERWIESDLEIVI